MPLKIEVGRLMSPQEMAERIKQEKVDFDTAVEKRKQQCQSLGLSAQLGLYVYNVKPEVFYRRLNEKESLLVSFRYSDSWGIQDFKKCEMPCEALEELAIAKNGDLFSYFDVTQLKNRTDFVLLGFRDLHSFLVVHWGEGPNTFAAIAASIRAEAEIAEKKRETEEGEKQRRLERNIISDVPIPPMAKTWITHQQYDCPDHVFRFVGKTIIGLCGYSYCKSLFARKYKITVSKSGKTNTFYICARCGQAKY